MNIDLPSTLYYGDERSLREFFAVHALAHQIYAQTISTKYNVQTPLFDVSDEGWLNDMIDIMRSSIEGIRLPPSDRVTNGLQLHHDLHEKELFAIGSLFPLNVQTVDFSDERQFHQWFYDHQLLHDFEDQRLGVG